MPLIRYLNYLAKIPEVMIERKIWKLFSRPPVSKSPANRPHQRRRLIGAKLASAQKGMHSEHVTQSNGGVVQKSSIRKPPSNMWWPWMFLL